MALPPNLHLSEDATDVDLAMQDEFLEEYELPIKACQTFQLGSRASASAVDYYEDQFTSVRNLMCQLNSLATVTALWRETKREYDAVLYLRPDVLYNCPFPVERLDSLEDNKVCDSDKFVCGYQAVADFMYLTRVCTQLTCKHFAQCLCSLDFRSLQKPIWPWRCRR